MLRTRVVSVARAVRAFATGKGKQPFLSDAIAKAAIGKNMEVATSFLSAFAPVVHGRQHVRVAARRHRFVANDWPPALSLVRERYEARHRAPLQR